jgi:hypothetical protein
LGKEDEGAEAVWLGEEDLEDDGELVGWFAGDEVALVVYTVEFGTHETEFFECAVCEDVFVVCVKGGRKFGRGYYYWEFGDGGGGVIVDEG